MGFSLKFSDLINPVVVSELESLRVLDISCGEHFTVALTALRESKIESAFANRFKAIT
jgi:hypothetical protein